jgi:predicted nucleotidyltransferase
LRRYGQARDELLARIIHVLEADARVAAVWLAGSFGRGVEDAWSDLDLHIAVADDALAAFWADRRQLYERVGQPVLIQPEMPSNGRVSTATRPPATRVLFDRVGIPVETPPALTPEERRGQANSWQAFFWAMAPIAVKYAGRGATRPAAGQIDLLTQSAIAVWRLVEQPDGPNPWEPITNRPINPELDAVLPRLGWAIDPAKALETISHLCAMVERMHPALATLGVTIPAKMPGEVARLIDLATNVFAGGDRGARRAYR